MPDAPSPLHEFVLRALAILALIALALFLWRIVDVLLLVFGAGLLAIVLHAAADPIRRRTRLPDSAALGTAVVGILVVLGAVSWLAGAELSAQSSELLARLPEAWTPVRRWLQQYELGRMMLQRLEDLAADFPLAERLTRWMARASGAVLEAVLVAVGGVYLAADPCRYRSGLLMLFPPAARQRVGGTVDAAMQALRQWLLAQLVVMAVVGTLTGVGMWLIGMPSPLALGLLAGLMEFVPYIGPIVAALPGLLLASTVEPLTTLYALAVYLVVQQIESNIVTPLVARRMLALPPAFVLFSMVALGTVLGPLGWIFAVPLAVVLAVAVGRLYVRETLGTTVEVPGEHGLHDEYPTPMSEVKRRIDRVEEYAGEAKRALRTGLVSVELRQCVESLHQQARQAQHACSTGQQMEQDGVRGTVARLEQAGDRAVQACRRAGRSVDPRLEQAVKRTHDEISNLKQQMQQG